MTQAMNKSAIRRIVFACDAACDIGVAVEEAVALAERWNAALHGVFMEDENLQRLAGLPFGRQVTLSSAVSETLSAIDLEKASSAMGAAMRRTLAGAAAQRGLEWSFGIVRNLSAAAALAELEGDILIVQGATRPFSGSWRPRSSLSSLPRPQARTMLICRQRQGEPGTIVVLPGDPGDERRTLLAGLAMAGPRDELTVLVRGGKPSRVEAAERIALSLEPAPKPGIRIEPAPADMPALLRRIDRLKPALIVLETGEEDAHAIRDMLAGTVCNLLVLR